MTLADHPAVLPHSPLLNAAYLPQTPLYGTATGTGWKLSPEPYRLNQRQFEQIERLGRVLWRFQWACEHLYRESLKGNTPAWVAALLHQGKPEGLLTFAAMKRFRSQVPLVIRPDLLVTEEGFALTEVDSVPGGLGFTSAMNEAYRQSGFEVIEPSETMPLAFLQLLKTDSQQAEPTLAVVLSDESADYRQEMAWLVSHIQPHYANIHLVHPKELDLARDRLVITVENQEKPVDLIYRFFELFDLANIAKIELIQYALKKGLVRCTPPFKPQLEEKLWLALLHHPVLQAHWLKLLGDADFGFLQGLVPQGWVIDPSPVAPQAVIAGLTLGGQPVQHFEALLGASQKERQKVLKPSGFSPLAWGSRGVTVGHDVSGEVWDETLRQALASYGQTPWILQTYHKPKAEPLKRFEEDMTTITPYQGRTRLCPYFFASPKGDTGNEMIPEAEVVLAGVLATSCPADKKIIHGMKDAVMAPCSVDRSL